jgi:multiple sugar transport system permease protein
MRSLSITGSKIDGCGWFRAYLTIIIPLTKTGLITLAVLTFNTVWNDYMGPMIYLDNDKLFTIQIGLASFRQQFSADYGAIMAGTVSSIIPVILLYALGQKHIVEGVAFAGVKG